jgi:flagellar basal body rod protein FlgC
MDTFADESSWLLVLAEQLIALNMPETVRERLKVISAVIANHRQVLEAADADLYRAREEAERLEKTLRIASFDLEDLFLRYKIVCSDLAQYDKDRAHAYLKYVPGLYEAIKQQTKTAE